MNTIAQDFSKHKWENRLVIIFTQDSNDSLYQKQLKELTNSKEDLLERRILVYHILPDIYKIGLNTENEWKDHTNFKVKDIPFEISLIGLDGGLKLSQTEILTAEKLFGIIDQMPMRRIEIKNKNK
ncbi:MAG: DUF4174 domain-containing protein [Melioribacteraceae bacterium]|nr:DUF4174 domain-containing protein [Melioribacteraceae bacterium]